MQLLLQFEFKIEIVCNVNNKVKKPEMSTTVVQSLYKIIRILLILYKYT